MLVLWSAPLASKMYAVVESLTKSIRSIVMGIVWFLLVGILAGWLAGQFMGAGSGGMLGDLVLGVIGAVVGGFVFRRLEFSAIGLRSGWHAGPGHYGYRRSQSVYHGAENDQVGVTQRHGPNHTSLVSRPTQILSVPRRWPLSRTRALAIRISEVPRSARPANCSPSVR